MPHDLDVLRENLRKDTAKMLGIADLKTMTAAESVRLSRATTLRLEIDDIETRKLNDQHQPFDLKSYIAASEALERLVGGQPEQATPTDPFTGAREELARFFEGRANALERSRERDENNKAASGAPPHNGSESEPLRIAGPADEHSPPAAAVPEGDEPPVNNVRTVYIDHAVLAEPLPPPAEHPLRSSSMNNPSAVPLPRAPHTVSPTYGAFSDYTSRRAGGFRRFDMPDGF